MYVVLGVCHSVVTQVEATIDPLRFIFYALRVNNLYARSIYLG